jgi:hypothetical protein
MRFPTSPARLDRSRFVLEFDEDFSSPTLDRSLWIPHYLPQWSSRTAAAARYRIGDGALHLRIEADQAPWSPEHDGALRVSNLQTGVLSGPVGSAVGQHHFREGLVVHEHQEEERLYTPHFGLVEARVRAIDDPRCLGALWLIGFEDAPQRSGELCVFELFGRDVNGRGARVGMGIHPFGDPALREDFAMVEADLDPLEFHTYAAAWQPGLTGFYIDDELVAEVDEAPDYPMQLMLNLYEFAEEPDAATAASAAPPRSTPYPKEFDVEFVRGYRLA